MAMPEEEGRVVVHEGGLVVVKHAVVVPGRFGAGDVGVTRWRLHQTGDSLLVSLAVGHGHVAPELLVILLVMVLSVMINIPLLSDADLVLGAPCGGLGRASHRIVVGDLAQRADGLARVDLGLREGRDSCADGRAREQGQGHDWFE